MMNLTLCNWWNVVKPTKPIYKFCNSQVSIWGYFINNNLKRIWEEAGLFGSTEENREEPLLG